jgi:hypothetical protein
MNALVTMCILPIDITRLIARTSVLVYLSSPNLLRTGHSPATFAVNNSFQGLVNRKWRLRSSFSHQDDGPSIIKFPSQQKMHGVDMTTLPGSGLQLHPRQPTSLIPSRSSSFASDMSHDRNVSCKRKTAQYGASV